MKIVVIGNGIAGFSAASALRGLGSDCDVTMISSEATPLYSACVLPDYISGEIPREQVFVKTIENYILRLGVQPLLGYELREIDPVTKKVAIASLSEMGGMGEKVVLKCVGLQCASLAEIFS